MIAIPGLKILFHFYFFDQIPNSKQDRNLTGIEYLLDLEN